jgi:hypothetical protein
MEAGNRFSNLGLPRCKHPLATTIPKSFFYMNRPDGVRVGLKKKSWDEENGKILFSQKRSSFLKYISKRRI